LVDGSILVHAVLFTAANISPFFYCARRYSNGVSCR